MSFIGDNQGLDKLCLQYSNKLHAKALCRNCDCKTENADMSSPKFTYTTHEKVQALLKKGNKDKLHDLSIYNIHNSLFDLNFVIQFVLYLEPHHGIWFMVCNMAFMIMP